MSNGNSLPNRFADVTFTFEQLSYLEYMHPPTILGPNATEPQMRHHNGQQSVLETIRGRTRGLRPKVPNRNTIPTPG